MATAKRLYLYLISLTGLVLLIAGAVSLLRLAVNNVGVGPRSSGSSNGDLDGISFSVALGLVGLALWLIHWAIVERMVRRQPAMPAVADATGAAIEAPDPAAAERRSIVRSLFFALVMWTSLSLAATLGIDLAGRAIADALGAWMKFSVVSLLALPDDWEVSITVVLVAVWAYHAWIRGRDVRQGPVIMGAAAWIARLYLYGAALLGVVGVLQALSSLIWTTASQVAQPSLPASGPALLPITVDVYRSWERLVIAALVGLAVWGAIWLSHWLYSERLRSGSTEQSVAERPSRVRLAFLMAVLVWGAATVVQGAAGGLGQLFEWMAGVPNDSVPVYPLWFLVLVPPLAAVPAGLAWWWHRRRAFLEASEGPAGVSARRIAGYLVALIGLYALAAGVYDVLSATFERWLAPMTATYGTLAETMWKFVVAYGSAVTLVGLAFWIWPWLSAQRRRAATAVERDAELGSSSRAYYLYVVAGASVLIVAASLVVVLYRYLRAGFGLDESALGAEVSGAVAALLVAAVVLAYHALVLRSDKARPAPAAVPGPMPPHADSPAAPTESSPGESGPASDS